MARPKAIIPTSNAGHVKWLNYGEPGSGKSRLIGTGEKTLVLANNPDETVSMIGGNTEMWVTPDLIAATEALEYLRHEGYKEYDWVWLDNGTLFQEQNMDRVMEDLVAAKPHRNRYVPDMHEYLQNQNEVGVFVRNLIALPMNVGITAHVMYFMDDDNEDAESAIQMPLFQGGQGAFSQKLCGYMNLVTFMGTRRTKTGTERYLITEKSKKMYAKDRFGALPRRIPNPSIPDIMEMIRKSGEPAPAARRKARTRKTPTKKAV